MKTVSTRVWGAGSVGAVVAIAAGGYFLGVQPQLERTDQAETAIVSSQSSITQAQVKTAAFAKVAANQAELQTKASVLAKSVPTGLQANTFIRRVNEVAALDAVDVTSVTVGAGTPYAVPAGIAAKAAAAVAAAAPAATPSAGAGAAPVEAAAPAVATAPALAATDPLITPADLTVIPMTVTVTGTADNGLTFVKDMQRDERLFTVSAVTVAPSTDGTPATITLTGNVYALKG